LGKGEPGGDLAEKAKEEWRRGKAGKGRTLGNSVKIPLKKESKRKNKQQNRERQESETIE